MVIGLDTATADVAVAVSCAEEILFEAVIEPQGPRPRHAATLLEQIELGVRAAGGWPAIEVIGVGVGPGSFTGLRVGIATARGLAQARGLPLAGVASLAALARGIEGPPERPRLALIDARRGELFAALHDAEGATLLEPFVAAPEAIAERACAREPKPLAAGDGSVRFRQQLEAAGVEVLPDADPAHRMAARNVCALAARAERVSPEELRPIYLRRPDAEIWREQQAGDGGRAGGA
jgi:tRNA threonylcarbamoyladenosine biosynthesis protein TsaB